MLPWVPSHAPHSVPSWQCFSAEQGDDGALGLQGEPSVAMLVEEGSRTNWMGITTAEALSIFP